MDDIDEFLERVKKSNRSFVDKWAMVTARWVDEENAANILEDTKTRELEVRKNALVEQNEKLADNAAERQIKATPEWGKRLAAGHEARHRANRLWAAREYYKMRHMEQQSLEATKRAELKTLGG